MRRKIGSTKRRKATPRRKTTTRRRRRISGIGSLDVGGVLMKAAGLGAGAVLARELNTIGVKQFPTLSPMVSGLIQIAAGAFLPIVVKNNKFIADMGDGMIANGVLVEVVDLGIISGYNGNPNAMTYRIGGGNNNIRAIAGTNRIRAIAGTGTLNTVSGVNKNAPRREARAKAAAYKGCY